jgi:hypothetical protein
MIKMVAVAALLSSITALASLPGSDVSVPAPAPSPEIVSTTLEASRLTSQGENNARTYLLPRVNGNRVAFCLEVGRCGKEAADSFCRRSGFEEALTFQRDAVQNNSARLRFREIKCWYGQVAWGVT